MNRKKSLIWIVAIAIAMSAVQTFGQVPAVVYNNIPNPLPPNYASLGYQATQTAEFGDYIFLGGTDRRAGYATVAMSNWALNSTYPSMPATGFNHPITLNIYAVDNSGPAPAVGALLGTKTQSFLIPWRPEADPTCSGGTAWRANNGSCYNGFAFTIKFDLRSLALTLPNDVILGVAYNTNTWGYNPIGLPGPYESLNVGLAVGTPASVGLDVETDALFWNTSTAGWYADGGTGGVGTFRRDYEWAPYSPAFQLTAYTVATTAAGCKNGGWQLLSRADASTFRNQGDCIQYVNTGR